MKKKLLSVVLIMVLSLSCINAVPLVSQAEKGSEYTSGDWVYSKGSGSCTITGYSGSDKIIIIPSTLGGNTVTEIGANAFKGKDITSLIIPDSVHEIGSEAFFGCSELTGIHFGNGVRRLGNRCFAYCDSLTSIELPASLTSSDSKANCAFFFCDSLKTASIAGGGVKIPSYLFGGCDALDNVTIPEGITEIGDSAFQMCESLEEITLPDTVQAIGSFAFYVCTSLKKIILPESVKSIGVGAFVECSSLEDFYDYNENTEYGKNDLFPSVFTDSPSVTIHGYPDSNARRHAKENNIKFVSFTEQETDDREKEMEESGKLKMYRLYNENSGEHFYTSVSTEKDNLVSNGWRYEGVDWIAPASSDTPVYRIYNPNSGEHHYTKDAAEKDDLVKFGWNDEGIGWYSDDFRGTPLYRLYNPNASGQYEAGGHHYTKDAAERDNLIAAGWMDEGIGWYGMVEIVE